MLKIEGVKKMKLEEIIDKAKSVIPEPKSLRAQLFEDCRKKFEEKKDFEYLLRFIDERGLEMFRKYEQKAFLLALQLFFENKFKDKQKTEEVLEKWKNIIQTKGTAEFIRLLSKELNEAIEIIRLLEKSIGQMRKARAGVQFQESIKFLLSLYGIKSEIPTNNEDKQRLGYIDIVVPSVAEAFTKPDKCFFITCKRTLRERWRQEVPQATVNQRFYFVTLDLDVPLNKIYEFQEKKLIIYLPTESYNKIVEESKDSKKPINVSYIRPLGELVTDLKN